MTIKRFLMLVFFVLLSLGIFLNIRYLKGINFQKNNTPIENYDIQEIWCHNSSKMSNTMTIKYKGVEYFVALSSGVCTDIEKGLIHPKLYYMKDKDVVFYEGLYVPFPYVYLTYIASILLPLFGFIVYRKKLNSNFKTM